MAKKCPKIVKSAYFWAERYFSLGLSTDHKGTIIESQTKKRRWTYVFVIGGGNNCGCIVLHPSWNKTCRKQKT